eukprot:Tbor_TRINITY_DN5744_c0_g5::TRINITY_DN5744_c0_g5_i1::g.20416::m.20416/K13989/DERL2_3; Derlin-2/3
MSLTFDDFWSSMQPVTKIFVLSAFTTTSLFTFGMVSPFMLLVSFDGLFWKLQIWRILTACVFFGKFGFPWMMNVATFYIQIKNNEEYHGVKRADFVWMLTFIIFVLHIFGFLLGMQLLSFALTMSLCWVWCRRNPTAILKIYMFSFQAIYFPWALMGFHLLMGMDIVDDIVGIVAGHLFIFLKDMLPVTHMKDIIPTPVIIRQWLPDARSGLTTLTGTTNRPPVPTAARNWGPGRRLGQ